MKLLPRVLFVVCVVLSNASAADLESSVKSESKVESKLEDDQLWDVGTQVYNDSLGEGGMSGTISSFNSIEGLFTVTWEDGTHDVYDDEDAIDQMVYDAQNHTQAEPLNEKSLEDGYDAGSEFGNDTDIVALVENDKIEEVDAGSSPDEGAYPEGEEPQYGVDDSREEVKEGPITDQMVENAASDVEKDESSNSVKDSEALGDTLGDEEFVHDPEEDEEIELVENNESLEDDSELIDNSYGVNIEWNEAKDSELDDEIDYRDADDLYFDDLYIDDLFENDLYDAVFDDFLGSGAELYTDDDEYDGPLRFGLDDDFSSDSYPERDDWLQIGGSSVAFLWMMVAAIFLLGSSAFGYKVYLRRRVERDDFSLSNSTAGFKKIAFD